MTFQGMGRASTSRDVATGFALWAVLVPSAFAYATIAGVPPVVGLYAIPIAVALYAVVGSSRHLVVAPMATAAALSAAAVAGLSADPADAIALTAALAGVAGVFALLAGAARLGFLAAFISEPVLEGFIIGLALTIIAGQAPQLFGLSAGHGSFFEMVRGFVRALDDAHATSVLVGLGSLVALLGLGRLVPRAPAPLIVAAVAIVAGKVFALADHGVTVVGQIPAGLPAMRLPDVAWSDYLSLSGAAVGIVIVGFAEGYGTAKTYAARARYKVDADRELLGLGAANVGVSLTSGMVVAGSLPETAVNSAAGARSQLSVLTAGGLTVLTLLFLTGLFEDLPYATLAALVITSVLELVDLKALRRLYGVYHTNLGRIYGHVARVDLIGATSALVGVLVFDILPGLFIGIAVSVVLMMYRASRPHVAVLGRLAPSGSNGEHGGRWVDVERHADARPDPDVVVIRPETGLFYANADNVHAAVLTTIERTGATGVVLDLHSVPVIDLTAAEMLVELADELAHSGRALAVANDIGQVRDLLQAAGADRIVDSTHPSVEAAVAAARTGSPSRPPGD